MKPFQQYASEGWYVARRAIPESLVRGLVARFQQDAKPCTDPQLRQSSRVEPHKFDEFGFMKKPLLNPHLGKNEKLVEFRAAILDLACSAAMLDALAAITLRPSHVLLQIMMFEQSATSPHQDWVYLDSFPQGCLTAAWVALEDISPEATRFFIIPGSQDFDQDFPHDWIWDSGQYLQTMTGVVQTQYADRVTIPEMRAGDVLFWNSRIIHGSLAGTDTSRSRLSLAVHYIPDGFGSGNRETPLIAAYPLPVVTGHPIPYTPDTPPTPATPLVAHNSDWIGKVLQRFKLSNLLKKLRLTAPTG
jgi:phytanoyl-CoA hydroxylase